MPGSLEWCGEPLTGWRAEGVRSFDPSDPSLRSSDGRGECTRSPRIPRGVAASLHGWRAAETSLAHSCRLLLCTRRARRHEVVARQVVSSMADGGGSAILQG